jgi:PPM family protein phosphatase
MNYDSEGNLNRSAGSKDSGRNVRNQLHLEQGNAILQLQLSLFQPAQLQLVVHRVEDERIDYHIKVTMLDFQFDNALLYIFRMGHGHFVTFGIKKFTIAYIQSDCACNNFHRQPSASAQFNLPGRMSQYKIEAGTGQHIGSRQEQQDRSALFAAPRAPGYMMAVLADGMGGRSGGSIAAEQVTLSAKHLFDEFSPLTCDVESMLQKIGQEAHTIIRLSGISSSKEPHSTMVVLVLTPEKQAFWAHVGDSRLYRFSGPDFVEHTIDHSYVEKLVSEGKISREQAKTHRLSNILVNVLGSSKGNPYVTVGRCENLKAGDSFLLCSDGLWHYFSNSELGAIIADNSVRQASEILISKAAERAAGFGDNCTLALVKLVHPPATPNNPFAQKNKPGV